MDASALISWSFLYALEETHFSLLSKSVADTLVCINSVLENACQ